MYILTSKPKPSPEPNRHFDMHGCVFCEIVEGARFARVVQRGALTLVVMDANPIAPGHLLVIPKMHFETMVDADDACLAEMTRAAKAMGALTMSKLGATGFNLLTASGASAQQSVAHLHFHVIPRSSGDGLSLWPHTQAAKPIDIEGSFNALR